MTLILDATPGGVSSNSYTSLAEADVYHEGHFYALPWTTATLSQKKTALVHATRLLDEQVEWDGNKTNRNQSLRWPRVGVAERDGSSEFYDPYYGYTIDSTIIPLWLKNATAELARTLMIEDRTAEPDMLEYTQMSVGTLSLTKDSSSRKDVLPESVQAMVAPYGTISSHTGIGFAKLVRA